MYHIEKTDVEKLRETMKATKNVLQYRKMEAVAMRGEGKKNEEIAKQTGFHPDMIGRYAKEYLEGGLEGLLFDGRKGGNNRNATEDEERKFLAQFEETAEKGQIVTVSEIASAYDKHFKKEHKSKSTVYYLLHKMGWRKVMPRSKHPNKASDEEIASSKKLTYESEK